MPSLLNLLENEEFSATDTLDEAGEEVSIQELPRTRFANKEPGSVVASRLLSSHEGDRRIINQGVADAAEQLISVLGRQINNDFQLGG